MTQEQGSTDDRAELKEKGDTLLTTFKYFPYFILGEGTYFFWDEVTKQNLGLPPSRVGCVPKWDAGNMQKYPLIRHQDITRHIFVWTNIHSLQFSGKKCFVCLI